MLEQAYFVSGIVGAAGVIASLLFLAFQLRQNTRTLRNQLWETHLNRIAQNFSRPLEERVATTVTKGKKNFNELSDPEKEIFAAWANEYIINVNRLIAFGRQGLLAPEVAAMSERNLKWFFNNPGAGQWWRDAKRQPVPAHFEAIIDAELAKVQQNAG